MIKINSSNCPLFNTGLYIEKVTGDSAKISMCCYQTQSETLHSVVDFKNNDYLESLRNSTDNVDQCSPCAYTETHGNQSYRQAAISAGNAFRDSTVLTTLTYNCENICNLTCLTCGPRYSSKWKPLYQKMGYPVTDIVKESTHHNQLYRDLDLSNLEFLHFQGGEPLLTQDHVEIIRQLKDQNNLENVIISYNTNGTVMVDPEVIELWKQAKLVKLYFSIDAVGEQFELIRNPAVWAQVEQTMFAYRDLDLPNLWLEIGTTVSIANLFYIQDLIDWRDQHYASMLNGDKINIYINIAGGISYGSRALLLNNISHKVKEAALAYADTLTDEPIKNILNSVLNTIKIRDNLAAPREYLDTVDKFKRTNWQQTLFKLHQHINE